MRKNQFLVFLMAFVAVFAIMNVVSAADVATFSDVQVNGVSVGTESIAVQAGETVDVTAVFTAVRDVDLASVEAWFYVDGKKTSYTSSRFALFNGSRYTKEFSLRVPSNIDLTDDVRLFVQVSSDDGSDTVYFDLRLQRDAFKVDVLSVELPSLEVAAGSVVPVNIVLKNRGLNTLEDLFVTVKIDALGISRRVYASDLTPVDSDDNDEEDAVEKTVFIQIPESARSGVYTLEVRASNVDVDADAVVMKSIVVSGSEGRGDVLTPVVSRTVKAGEEAVYDLVLVNSGNRMQIYTISVEAPNGVSASVDQSLVSIPADSTMVVKVRATANKEGTYALAVNVNSDGALVKRVSLTNEVDGSKAISTNPTVVLTIVLAIIFVVLVVVLIILLTRKPARTEELGESYY